jgi:NodT family efflux transporter outer membrane factor (OMF) lipoprotein
MTVGPDFVRPDAPVAQTWIDSDDEKVVAEPEDYSQWWTVFNDPVLNNLIDRAYQQNLSLQIVGLRVLEARAELGFVTGQLYPQVQQARAAMTNVNIGDNTANTLALDPSYNDYEIGFDAAWELDFWGRFRRGIESADANLVASIADYDDVLVTLTAEVARTYVLIRTLEERIRLAQENVKIQQRSLEIADVRFEAGLVTELDFQQARSLLRDTQALIPLLETDLRQAKHALSVLLGLPPSELTEILGDPAAIPTAPAEVAVGIPAELLRRRPDIRSAELQAASQSALIGLAKADLYPHFTLAGSIGLRSSDNSVTRAGGAGGSNFSDLFNSDSFELFAGPSLSWDIFNYGRLKNRVRVEDARFQQLVVNYQNSVLEAAREAEDAIVGFLRSQERVEFLADSVTASKRSVDLSLIQYREGVVDYQRVLDTERFLTAQQDSMTETMGSVALSLIAMYKALGGGWEIRAGNDFVPEGIKEEMKVRTNWGDLLEPEEHEPVAEEDRGKWRAPDF